MKSVKFKLIFLCLVVASLSQALAHQVNDTVMSKYYYCSNIWVGGRCSCFLIIEADHITIEYYQPWQGWVIPFKKDTIYVESFGVKTDYAESQDNNSIVTYSKKGVIQIISNNTLTRKMVFRLKSQKEIPKRVHKLRNIALLYTGSNDLEKELIAILGNHTLIATYINEEEQKIGLLKLAKKPILSNEYKTLYLKEREEIKGKVIKRINEIGPMLN